MRLGNVGIWTSVFEAQPMSAVRDAAAEIDELGYGALWFAGQPVTEPESAGDRAPVSR